MSVRFDFSGPELRKGEMGRGVRVTPERLYVTSLYLQYI